MKGLKLEPGCRQAWVTWLNLLLAKSKPPTRARIAPCAGPSTQKRLRPRAPGSACSCPWRPASRGPPHRGGSGPWMSPCPTGPRPPGRRPAPVTVMVLARLQHGHHLPGRGFQHDRGPQLIVVRVVGQASATLGVQGCRLLGQIDRAFRPAVVLATLEVHQAPPQSPVSGILVFR
jgi:hypothetical protein